MVASKFEGFSVESHVLPVDYWWIISLFFKQVRLGPSAQNCWWSKLTVA